MTPEQWYDTFVHDAKFSPLSTREMMIATFRAAIGAERAGCKKLAEEYGCMSLADAIERRARYDRARSEA